VPALVQQAIVAIGSIKRQDPAVLPYVDASRSSMILAGEGTAKAVRCTW
jgi:hypothetical protein